jgi:hypothetical protein
MVCTQDCQTPACVMSKIELSAGSSQKKKELSAGLLQANLYLRIIISHKPCNEQALEIKKS